MDDQPSLSPPPTEHETIFTPERRTQTLVAIASIICYLIFWFGGAWLGIPRQKGFQDSLLQQHSAVPLLVTYILIICGAAIGTVVCGRSWLYGGLFAAAVGLSALSARGGTMRDVLFYAQAAGTGHGIFLWLFLEQCLLLAPVAALWWLLWRPHEAMLARYALEHPQKPEEQDLGSTAAALVAQFLIAAAVMLLLAATDAKKQVTFASFLGCFAGTSLAEHFFADRKAGGWYWVGPLAVGAIGYLMAYLATAPPATGWMSGQLGGSGRAGLLSTLARPLPLDYASAGTAGALLGFWIGRERPEVATSNGAGGTLRSIIAFDRASAALPSDSPESARPQ
jgi:hypothetical protein